MSTCNRLDGFRITRILTDYIYTRKNFPGTGVGNSLVMTMKREIFMRLQFLGHVRNKDMHHHHRNNSCSHPLVWWRSQFPQLWIDVQIQNHQGHVHIYVYKIINSERHKWPLQKLMWSYHFIIMYNLIMWLVTEWSLSLSSYEEAVVKFIMCREQHP